MSPPRLEAVPLSHSTLDPLQVAALIDRQASAPAADESVGTGREAACKGLADGIIADCPRTNLVYETIDAQCVRMIQPDEAWNAMVMPMRVQDGVVICATTAETLDRAISVMQGRATTPYRFVIVPIRQLEQYICQLYDYEGLDISDVA